MDGDCSTRTHLFQTIIGLEIVLLRSAWRIGEDSSDGESEVGRVRRRFVVHLDSCRMYSSEEAFAKVNDRIRRGDIVGAKGKPSKNTVVPLRLTSDHGILLQHERRKVN